MMPRRTVAAIAVACALFMVGARIATGQLAGRGGVAISNGIASLARRDVPGAMREFRLAANDPNPALRSAGEQWLGHLSWVVYADPKAASGHLDRALAGATDSTSVLVERARFLVFERRYRDATQTARQAMRQGLDGERRGLAARQVVNAAVDGAFAALALKKPIADSTDVTSLQDALDTLRQRVHRFPGRTSDALALLNAGVLLANFDAIRAGWLSYFLLADDSTRSSLDQARRLIEDAGRGRIAEGLARSRLYESAALLPQPGASNDWMAYGVFIHDLRAAANEFYRRSLTGIAREGDLDRTLNAQTRRLWVALSWPDGEQPYYPAAVPGEIKKRFGALMSIERPKGIPELHLAGTIASFVPGSREPASRHRQVVLDGVATNGLDAWLLDGAGGRAGWVSGDTVFEMRTAFTEAPFRAWIGMTEPQSIPGELFRIMRDSAADLGRAQVDSASYLPGVAARLFRAGVSAILDSLGRGSKSYAEKESTFVAILFRELTATTIGLHEARHLADARQGNRRSSEIDAEFRAKIDEVAEARHPKLAMTAILHPNIGDASSHGQANRRIMLGLVSWIRANAGGIAGYDPKLPALVQLPLLSDEQLRAAFKSMRLG